MTISAKVVLDSSSENHRLITMELTYPRFIHSEFMTHRVFSRNASSSRAIPVNKLIDQVVENPAMPIHWGKNQPGMQAQEELSALGKEAAEHQWLLARDHAVGAAREMVSIGAHKQIVNRILEPFSHITVLVTSDQWANFFALRKHADAQPEIRELAEQMLAAIEVSKPVCLVSSEWHTPYIDDQDRLDVYSKLQENRITRGEPRQSDINEMLCAISAARCARVSYLTHDKRRPTIDEDLDLFRKLACANPPHMSPCEHQARPGSDGRGNFRNWSQFRHVIKDNTVYDY